MQIPEQSIENYLAGIATSEEIKLVNEWFYCFDDEVVEISADHENLRNEIKERISLKLQQHINTKNKPSIRLVSITKKLVAAAVLIIIIGGSYLFLYSKKEKTTVSGLSNRSSNKAILPGGNKAILTLANGDQIILDNAENGVIGKQGNTKIIKLNNGQLAYNANTSQASVAVYNTITTPRGGQYQVVLPDGTTVLLNSATSLKFPTVFTNNNREVTLDGEAYFEVEHQLLSNGNKNPFVVNVNHGADNSMKVTVWGTKFNIMDYDDEDEIKTTLVEGSVEASNKTGKILMVPGQQAALKQLNNHFRVSSADIDEVLAWKNGEFRFKETNIKTIMRQLARWYDVDVEYNGDVDNVSLTGIIPKKENIQQLLDVLATTGRVNFKITGNKIITTANYLQHY